MSSKLLVVRLDGVIESLVEDYVLYYKCWEIMFLKVYDACDSRQSKDVIEI
jgi:hypothetical protein